MSPAYPEAGQARAYAEVDSLAAAVDAEAAVFHSAMGDPRLLPAPLRRRLGDGLFAPQHPMILANDVEHFRHTEPGRCDALVARLAALGERSEAGVYVMPEVQSAFSFARWAQAFHADAVCSHGLGEVSFHALVTSHLLDLPRVLFLSDVNVAFEYALLLPLHVEQASAIVTANDAVGTDLVARFGERIRSRIVRATEDTPARELLLRALAEPRAAGAPRRGPQAAFVTRSASPCDPGPAVRPFLLLGAERTGSNLLVELLASCRGFACANELFNPRLIENDTLPWIDGAGTDRQRLLRQRRADPAALHAQLLRDGASSGASQVGFKLLYFHGLVDDRIVDHLVAERDLAVVHLLRADRLRRWLSLARARDTDQWSAGAATPRADAAREPLHLDVLDTVTEFALVELLEERYRALFADHRVVELDYDSFTGDLAGAARQLGALFGRPLGELTPRTHKTGLRDLEQGIRNLGELRDALRDTRWSHLAGGAAP